MKKVISIAAVVAFLMILGTADASAQSVDDVLKKMIDAQGGAKLLKAVKDTTVVGDIDVVAQGISGKITLYQKEPNMMRQDIEVMGMMIVQAYDGTIAWMDNPQTGIQEMDEELTTAFSREALGVDSLLNPKKHGITYTLKGNEKVNETDCIVLEQKYSDGHTATLYLDAKTYLAVKTKSLSPDGMGGEALSEAYTSDYKKTGDGILVAHSITTYRDGQEYVNMTLTEIKYNSGLDDAIFKMEK